MRFILALFIALFLLPAPARAAENDLLNGSCNASSHTAEGQIGEDLTARQSRFYCDSAVITFFNKKKDHVMVTFSEKKSHHSSPISFAGKLHQDGVLMDVNKVYLSPGVATPISSGDGWCKFFFKNGNTGDLVSIFCGAKVDEEGRRTTAVITFEPSSSPAIQNADADAAMATNADDLYADNPSLDPLKKCFASNPITITEEEADTLAQSNDYSFLNPPSICQKKINQFVDDCSQQGHKKGDCQMAEASLWVAMSPPFVEKNLRKLRSEIMEK